MSTEEFLMRYIYFALIVLSSSLGALQYLIPDDHPAKALLDEITATKKYSVFHDMETMTKAGFEYADAQPTTGIIVTRHPRLPGYIIKAYLDTQKYYSGRSEDYYWEKRAEGARLIQQAIDDYGFEHLLKVPQKWIYELPSAKSVKLPKNCYPKRSILIEDDMDIVSDEENRALWASPQATHELLYALHTVITKYRFRDCAKPANCPFSDDGRVALVDTQSFYKKKIGYSKLTKFLIPSMQQYWKSLSHVGVEGDQLIP